MPVKKYNSPDGMNYKSAKKRAMVPGAPSVPAKGSAKRKYKD